jgi:hypothetical protein
VASENIYGKTYGIATEKSATKDYVAGIDNPPEEKYRSQGMAEFQKQTNVNWKTAAQSVGVIKKEDIYKKPIDPKDVNKFWGIEDDDMDELVKDKHFEKNKNIFFGFDPKDHTQTVRVKKQTEEEAIKAFFAPEEKKELKLGDPIPGYSGTCRRVVADNVFGMTYGEARRRAHESQNKIQGEKGETLKMNSTFVPAYKRHTNDEDYFE